RCLPQPRELLAELRGGGQRSRVIQGSIRRIDMPGEDVDHVAAKFENGVEILLPGRTTPGNSGAGEEKGRVDFEQRFAELSKRRTVLCRRPARVVAIRRVEVGFVAYLPGEH